MSAPLLLSRRLEPAPTQRPDEPGEGQDGSSPLLVLALSADERQRLRGHCRSACGRDLLLQLPRGGGPLEPLERLAGDDGVPRVRVEAAPEELLRVRSDDPLALLRAAYHLGNRHVALELRLGELRLLQDAVLADMLRGLGVSVTPITAPFRPESGAYSHGAGHGHDQPEGEDRPWPHHGPSHDASHQRDVPGA